MNNRVKTLTVTQIEALKEWDIKKWWPTRALLRTWWSMPHFLRDGTGKPRYINKIDSSAFEWLKNHREEYFDFLEKNGLEQNLYDRTIAYKITRKKATKKVPDEKV